MILKKIILFVFFLTTSIGYSQLTDFNFSVVSTSETCAGNGTLQMTVSNTTSGSEIVYQLYLAPDFSNAIAETTSDSFNSLQSGDYRVVATQSLNGESNFQQEDIIIEDLVIDLDFGVSYETFTECDVTGTISVNIVSGNPSSYEIISGPVTMPLQASNEFPGLPSGTYIIRVFDECNNALSKTFTMQLANNRLTISPSTLPVVYDSCNSVQVSTVISPSPGTQITYPLSVVYAIDPPDGSPNQIFTENLVSGPTDVLQLSHPFQLFGNDVFELEIFVTDSCGNQFSLLTSINPNPSVSLISKDAPCATYYLGLSVTGFTTSYTINFDDAPDDFDPATFNSLYPGPVTEPNINFGSQAQPVPFGNYVVSIVDFCGRTESFAIEIKEKDLDPIVTKSSGKCGVQLGLMKVELPDDRKIVSAIITVAPPTYTETLPSDITFFVGEDGVLVADLPAGDYEMILIDDCGYEYHLESIVPDFEVKGLIADSLPNCDPGSGSVKVSSGNGKLVSLVMTEAPLTYMEELPYDVTFNIDPVSGVFFMSDLPAGNYSFESIDECGFEAETSISVIGYTSTQNGYTVIRNCGAFNLGVFDTNTTVTNQKYWFQKFFPDSNAWGHPYTGVSYEEGTLPDTTNSISLTNLGMVYNLFVTGEFRIIKSFQSFNNGSNNNNCLEQYATFTVSDKLIINGAYSLDCNGGSDQSDVILDVIGVEPFTYNITSPYAFNNGNNNIFSGLAPGIYNFEVSDNCGNIKNIFVEVGNLVPLARANTPESMLVCRNDTNQVGIFILSNQNNQILGNQNPDNYTITYHLNQTDADSGNAPLDIAYTNITNPQTIFARVTHKTLDICYATTSFPIFIGNKPILTPTDPIIVCAGTTRTLNADPGYDSYEWTTGETTQSIVIAEPGTYGVVVKNIYQDFTCDSSKEFIVTGSSIATFVDINTSDWSAQNNSVTIVVSGTGNYVYSLDGINYQPENTFTNLLPGQYTVYVKDLDECGIIDGQFFLIYYPKFFTPNGDGYNDTWNLQFAYLEPNTTINIFDRYGKFIIKLTANGPGWDGTYKGKLLPSTDYWFVVTREDGTTHKGHFAMKR
ncbi:T9SS type B sorting domain-containing protein [Flavobacterium sp. PLA-1-15]|uniref:T9SS type B sorting domain-containing protein n=1 Tax=Flavobacterium sp. PLA-1-15 TaxID=3380533 RepID=UPI003B786A50